MGVGPIIDLNELLNSKSGEGEIVTFLGRKVERERLQNNFAKAKNLVEEKARGVLPVNWNQLTFEQLEGAILGESRENEVVLDPILLLHPASRMAMVLMHELLHDNKQVMNDNLVEAVNEEIFGKKGFSTYNSQMAEQFAKMCQMSVMEVWKLYRDGNFLEMYRAFEKGFEDGESIKEFNKYFPELTFTQKPWEVWSRRRLQTQMVREEVNDAVNEVTG